MEYQLLPELLGQLGEKNYVQYWSDVPMGREVYFGLAAQELFMRFLFDLMTGDSGGGGSSGGGEYSYEEWQSSSMSWNDWQNNKTHNSLGVGGYDNGGTVVYISGIPVFIPNLVIPKSQGGSYSIWSSYETYKQEKTNWCAFAVAQTIYKRYGWNLPQGRIADMYYETHNIPLGSNKGVSDVLGYLQQNFKYDENKSPFSVYTVDQIKSALQSNIPVVAGIINQTGHAILLTGITNENGYVELFYFDPWQSEPDVKQMSWDYFSSHHGFSSIIYGIR